MKKDLKTLNKSVAIAIAAAMTATSAPTPLLASDLQMEEISYLSLRQRKRTPQRKLL